MSPFIKTLGFIPAALLALLTLGVVVLTGLYLYLAPQLPSADKLTEVRLQVPLKVYTRAGGLIAEFGEMRRIPVQFGQVPKQLVQAVLAAEDDRFYSHPGVDYQGLLRAALSLAATGEKKQGGSTITMQVARNFFLSSEKTFMRKFREILLAFRIEQSLSKDQILELYLNKIYYGNRAYGVAAAAQFYYGAQLNQLTLAQMATLAGLPKAPSRHNPIVNLERAVERRDYILERMHVLGYIGAAEYQAARASAETAARHAPEIEVEAPHMAEMARTEMVRRYGETEAYTGGYEVYTTLDARQQTAANQALRAALLEYDQRHGYRKRVNGNGEWVNGKNITHHSSPLTRFPADWQAALEGYTESGGLLPALVLEVDRQGARAYTPGQGVVELTWAGMSWARRYVNENSRGAQPKTAHQILKPGDIIRLQRGSGGVWLLAQLPAVEGGLVALHPATGAISALAGGFNFYQSNFNRVLQANRQPGSSFKPFLYSAALERGFTPASVVNDAPVIVEGADLGSTWRPENFGGKFYGPTRLRNAIAHSRNMVSIRVLRAMGVPYAVEYAARFGFKPEQLPKVLSLALGSGSVTPLELARAYAVFANGGYLIEPYFINRIVDAQGRVLMQADPLTVCAQCDAQGRASVAGGRMPGATEEGVAPHAGQGRNAPRVISAQNAYLMNSMLRDVIRVGTARRALELKRGDLAGKTGTTNDLRDAWFAGFNPELVAAAWVGFDNHAPLGDEETGGRAALPAWMRFMEAALKDVPEQPYPVPAGIVTLRIDPESGALAAENDAHAITEVFNSEQLPAHTAQPNAAGGAGAEQLF